jgi:hypothetical protein
VEALCIREEMNNELHGPVYEEDLFGGLPEQPDPTGTWDFNRLQAAALAGVCLSVLLTIVEADLKNWWAYTSFALAAAALPVLIMYLVLESDRFVLAVYSLRGLLAIGQTLAAAALFMLVASHSWAAAIIGSFVFACCLSWSICYLPKGVSRFPAPQFHRTKGDRFFWAISEAIRELNLNPADLKFDRRLGPGDIDATALRNVSGPPEILEKLQQKVRRILLETAKTERHRDREQREAISTSAAGSSDANAGVSSGVFESTNPERGVIMADSAVDEVSLKERYDFVKCHLLHHDEKITKAFEHWTTLVAAIIGGVFAFRIQQYSATSAATRAVAITWEQIRLAGASVLCLATLASLLLIYINASAWIGFRRAEIKLNPHAPPITCRSYRGEILMAAIELAATGAAIWFLFSI